MPFSNDRRSSVSLFLNFWNREDVSNSEKKILNTKRMYSFHCDLKKEKKKQTKFKRQKSTNKFYI